MSEAEEKLNELLTQDEIYDIGKQFYKNFSIIDKLPELPEFLIAQIAKLKEAGYLPVEPVQLEVLSDEERMSAFAKRWPELTGRELPYDTILAQAISQATIVHNLEKNGGRLYRLVTPEVKE